MIAHVRFVYSMNKSTAFWIQIDFQSFMDGFVNGEIKKKVREIAKIHFTLLYFERYVLLKYLERNCSLISTQLH